MSLNKLQSGWTYDQLKPWLLLSFRRASEVSTLVNVEPGHAMISFSSVFNKTTKKSFPNRMLSGGAVAFDSMSPSVFLLWIITISLLAHSALASIPLGTNYIDTQIKHPYKIMILHSLCTYINLLRFFLSFFLSMLASNMYTCNLIPLSSLFYCTHKCMRKITIDIKSYLTFISEGEWEEKKV